MRESCVVSVDGRGKEGEWIEATVTTTFLNVTQVGDGGRGTPHVLPYRKHSRTQTPKGGALGERPASENAEMHITTRRGRE